MIQRRRLRAPTPRPADPQNEPIMPLPEVR
jgi:hypothetical protein